MGTAVVANLAARAGRQITARLRDAGATSSGRAVPLVSDSRLARRQLARLVQVGAVHQTPEGYWLDEPGYAAYGDRRGRALGLALLAGVALATAVGLAGRR